MEGQAAAVGRWARRAKEGSEGQPDALPERPADHRRLWLASLIAGVATGAVAVLALRPAGRVAIGRLGRFAVVCVRSFRSPPVPRELPWIVVKRMRPRLRDSYGHWWVELDATESYGWWPRHGPTWLRTLFLGGQGSLNGSSRRCLGHTSRLDPRHGDGADHQFHPTLVVRKSDWRVRRDLRTFARRFEGDWRWSVKRDSTNCRSFQLGLLEAAGLVEGEDWLQTRGQGCPLLHVFRTARCSLRQLRHRHLTGHRRGGPCGCPALQVPPLPGLQR